MSGRGRKGGFGEVAPPFQQERIRSSSVRPSSWFAPTTRSARLECANAFSTRSRRSAPPAMLKSSV